MKSTSLSHCQQNQIFISSYRHKLFDKNAILNKQRIKQQSKRTFAQFKAEHFSVYYPSDYQNTYSHVFKKTFKQVRVIKENIETLDLQKWKLIYRL